MTAGQQKVNNLLNIRQKIIEETPDNTLHTEVVVPLKYLSNFWRFLDLSLINCKVELDLSWSKTV